MMFELRAYAKINLTLEVLSEREDGYHNIASIFQTVNLFDTLRFEKADSLSLECSLAELATVDNLVYRAARLFQEVTGQHLGARIHLDKGIPVTAGLGGGSSDAAATLLGLRHLWGSNIGMDVLHKLAIKLGSDVPFFLNGGTVQVTGKGESMTPLPPLIGDLGFVLLYPDLAIPGKTELLYHALPLSAYTDGSWTFSFTNHLLAGHPLKQDKLFNAFEAVALSAFPGLEVFWAQFEKSGADYVHLVGSGPTLFTCVPWDDAKSIHQRLERQGYQVYLVRSNNQRGSN